MSALQRPTLVLNRNWQPIHVTTVIRALTMLWSDTAHVICPESYRSLSWADWIQQIPATDAMVIRTGKLRIALPEVVRLSDYDRFPSQSVTFSRSNLMKRDHYTCQYCQTQPGRDHLTIDHVVPRSKGGPNTWVNCVVACVGCNVRKADRTPEQAGMRLKRKPVQPAWQPFYAAQGVRVQVWNQFMTTKADIPQLVVRG